MDSSAVPVVVIYPQGDSKSDGPDFSRLLSSETFYFGKFNLPVGLESMGSALIHWIKSRRTAILVSVDNYPILLPHAAGASTVSDRLQVLLPTCRPAVIALGWIPDPGYVWVLWYLRW